MWKVDYPTGTDTVFTFDNWDRVTQMVDAAGTTAWTYNAADELTTFTSPQGVVQYEYDAADGGKLKKLIEPGIGETLYQYAAGTGQLWKITNPHGETTEFGYDEGQRPSWTKFASGAREEYGYDYRGRMESVALKNSAGATLRLTEYAFDPASNLVSTTVDGVSTSFVHDAIGQLLSETRTGSAPIAYTYDANGNRLTRTVGTVTETYVSNERDELVSVLVDNVPVREFTVDLAGRTTSVSVPGVGTTTLSYDFEDRVTGISYPGGSSSSFGYNGFDTRVSATGPSGSRTYRWAGAGVTAPVLGDGVSHFTPGLSVRTGSESRFQHFGLKNIDAQSSSSEALVATRTYDAYGNTVGSSGSWSGPFGYGGAFGYQSEPDSGLQLLGHRYYDPSSGRFLSRDKARDGRNWYGYCGNAPLTRADPEGTRVTYLYVLLKADRSIYKIGITRNPGSRYRQWWLGMLGLKQEEIAYYIDDLPGGRRQPHNIHALQDERALVEEMGGPGNGERWSAFRNQHGNTGTAILQELASFAIPWWLVAVYEAQEYVKNEHIIPMVERARKRRQQSLEYWLSE